MKILTALVSAAALSTIAAPAQAAEVAPTAVAPIASWTGTAPVELTRDPPPHARAYGRRGKYRDYVRYDDDYYDDDYYDRRRDRIYDRRGRYIEPRRIRRGDRVWRGRDGRYYCRRDNGTTGLIIGAAGGALLGRAIDTRGDRTVGTLLGGALGAVLGREIDRGGARCR
ncbi:glycine zipper 2TM domain-containing protein [Erythrobacter rubeus]|uniref:17 kDa surface antigen n=1 Tax=Erythrobacter rubeus TaxID=2760803 RepID=A0ABR8KQI8_9SPHN|nr:glycine zipper 2TM domain-containing protein [Erythrobacter rubeus]MBD2841483.1 glycine zipper 2TM domain-containing protein [Erythrobacter rubeus]